MKAIDGGGALARQGDRPVATSFLASTLVFVAATGPFARRRRVETHGPLGTLWAGLGLGAFYTALIWVNLLLGHMLTPLFLLPLTWLQDAIQARKAKRA